MARQTKQSTLYPQVLAVNALVAIAAGALMGALVAMPCQLELPDTAYTAVRSLVAAGVLFGLNARQPDALTFEPDATWSAGEEK